MPEKKKDKLKPKWEGPFIIDEVLTRGAYRVRDASDNRLEPNHNSYGVVSTDLDGALFKVNVAVSRAYPQNDSGKSVWHPSSERPVYPVLHAQRPCLLATHNNMVQKTTALYMLAEHSSYYKQLARPSGTHGSAEQYVHYLVNIKGP